MTKLLFINRYYYPDSSATSQLLTDLASALAEAGYSVAVICSRLRYDEPATALPRSEVIAGVVVRRVWTTRFGRHRLLGRVLDYLSFYVSSSLSLFAHLRPGDTLIAKTDPPLLSIPAMLIARARGAQQINWLQDIFPEVATALGANPLPRSLDRLLRRWRNASLRSARVNIVLGARMRSKLSEMGVHAAQIAVIPNWAERSPPDPKPSAASRLREKLGLGGRFVVAYSGNLGRAHEYQTLLDAAEFLRDDDDTVFLMIGGGLGMTRLAAVVAERGLSNFRFLDYLPRSELADGLACADVHWVSLMPDLEGYIVPSKFYGILAAARPVIFIGDPAGELAFQINASGCGKSIEVGDAKGLANLLNAWKADPTLLMRLGEAGYRSYGENYAASKAFEKWVLLFTQPGRAHDACFPGPSGQ